MHFQMAARMRKPFYINSLRQKNVIKVSGVLSSENHRKTLIALSRLRRDRARNQFSTFTADTWRDFPFPISQSSLDRLTDV